MQVMENWHDIPGLEGRYQVSNLGNVKSLDCAIKGGRWGHQRRKGKLLKPSLDSYGYQIVNSLPAKLRLVHRLVLLAFVGPCPNGAQTRHINGIRSDNRLENLCYGTAKENSDDKKIHGTFVRGSRQGLSKLTEQQVVEIRRRYSQGHVLQRELAAEYGVAQNTISHVLLLGTWKHV